MNIRLKNILLFCLLCLPFFGSGQAEKMLYHWSDFPAERSMKTFEAFKKIYETDTTIRPDFDQRLAFFKKGFNAATKLNVQPDIIFFGQRLSNNYLDIDSFSQAIFYVKQIIELDYDTISVARAYNSLGYLYLNLGDYVNALKSLFTAVKYGKLLENGWESYPLGNIVSVYKNLEDYDNAIKYIRVSIEIDKKAAFPNREYGLVYNYSYLLMFYQETGQLDSCLQYVNLTNQNIEAIDTFESRVFQEVICFAYIAISDFYTTINNLDLAKHYIDLAKQKKTEYITDNILCIEGKYYLKKRDFQQIIKIIQEFEALSLQNFKAVERLLNLKIDYYTAINDFKNVAKVQEELIKNQKEKFGNDRLRFSTFANAEFENLEQQQQIEKLENQRYLDKLRYRNRNIIVAIVLIGFIMLGFLMYRWNRQKEAYSKALEHKNEQLKDIDTAKTQFFTNISHELKTPLTLIINPLQKVLKTRKLDIENQYLVQSATNNSLQLLDLVYQLLELTKFENDKVEIHHSTIHLKKTIKRLHTDFAPLAKSRHIDFELQQNINDNLYIKIDEYKLTTIFKNLIANAIKFTSDGGQVITRIKENNKTITIQVSDTGRGIHIKDLPYVFDRYYQSKISGDIMEGGTGIGLAICKEYVEIMGGTIRVESVFGQGSVFVVDLPKVVVNQPNLIATTSLNNVSELPFSRSLATTKNESLGTILVVEDNLNMQEYLEIVLQPNYKVITALHGKAALEILNQNHSIDLIISDLMMPEMNGYELVTHLKNTPKFAAIPTIMLTAMSGMDEKLKALRIGIDDYIVKPFVEEELLVRIENLITFSENRKTYKQATMLTNTTEQQEEKITDTTNSVQLDEEDLKWLAQFEQIVKENYQDANFKIDMFTEELLTNRSKLYQEVKRLTGLTPKSYINEVRFRAARTLLENRTNLTIKAIAYKVGFKDEKYFSRNFKKRFGQYPSAFLK